MCERCNSITRDQLAEAAVVGVNLALDDQLSAESPWIDPGPIGMYAAEP